MEANIQAEAMIETRMKTGSDKEIALMMAKLSMQESIKTNISKLRRCFDDAERKSICNNLCFDDEVLTELRKM